MTELTYNISLNPQNTWSEQLRK